MPEHVVEEGECVSSIAADHGLFWQTVWDHASNAGLKQQRKDPNVLMPGDKLFVPDLTPKRVDAACEKKHRFRKKNAPAKLRLRLLDAKNKPRANVKYRLLIDGTWFSGSTDGDGMLEQTIPPEAQSGTLFIENEGAIPLSLGGLDPVDADSGVIQRLRNLGYDCGDDCDQWNEDCEGALKQFQESQGLQATGQPDQATRDKLLQVHGS